MNRSCLNKSKVNRRLSSAPDMSNQLPMHSQQPTDMTREIQ